MGFADPQRLGAGVVSRADLSRELGVPGTLWAGYNPFDAYHPELQGPTWCSTVDEMRRCGPITAIELCITMPIAETEWRIECDSDELKELAEQALFSSDGLSTTWSDVIRRAAMSALYGTWLFEIIWKEVDGALLWGRLADRLPASIWGYELDASQGLAAVKQRGRRPGISGEWVNVDIPAEKMLLFPYRMEGANWHGISILRGAYIHWYCCQLLYRIANVGVEHNLLGIPAIGLPENYTDEDRAAALAMLQSIYRHEASAIVLPPGWELLDTSHLGNGSIDTLPLIEHHRNELFRCAMVGWVLGGETTYSAQAGVDAMMHFGLIIWNFLAKSIADVFNRHGLPRLVRMNTSSRVKSTDMPTLVPNDIGGLLRLQAAAQFITALSSGGFLKPDGELEDENFFRAGLGMNLKDPETEGALAAAQAQLEQARIRLSARPGDDAGGTSPAPTPGGRNAVVGAGLAPPAAQKPQTFADPQRHVAGALDEWQTAGQAHLGAILSDLLGQLGGDQAVSEIAVKPELVAAYAGWIQAWLERRYETAWVKAQSDLGLPPTPPAGGQDAGEKARVLAADHAQAALTEVQLAVLRGESPEQIAGRYAELMSRRVRVDLVQTQGPQIAQDVAEAALA
ncbi:MAG: hypothetical protein HYU66_23060 [Armatimonadetes bacterium]|nr:hypothetical protein [Armatimonadota bacterium]